MMMTRITMNRYDDKADLVACHFRLGCFVMVMRMTMNRYDDKADLVACHLRLGCFDL